MTHGDLTRINSKNSIVYCVSEQKCYEVTNTYESGVLTIYRYKNIYGLDMNERRFFKNEELLDRDYRLL